MQIMQLARVEYNILGTITSNNNSNNNSKTLVTMHCIALHWLHWLHCIALNCITALRCIALHWLHCIRTCLESFVGYPEISQWPLVFINRLHAHDLRNAFTFAFAYDMFGIFCEICRNQSMPPRFYSSDSCTCERQEDTQTWRHKERQRERLTDKQKHWYMSHPDSLFPFYAKPSLTWLNRVSVAKNAW